MHKSLRHILLLLLVIFVISTLNIRAQNAMPDKVGVGTTRHYRVTGSPGSVFTWKINGLIQSSVADVLEVTWTTPDVYTVEVQEHDLNLCSSDIKSGLVTVVDIPTVVPQTTCDSNPLITGTAIVGVGETFSVTVNGITYPEGDGNLTLSGTDWSLQIPEENNISDGIYEVIAEVTFFANNSATDNTSDELIIQTLNAANDSYTTDEDTPVTILPLTGDSGPDPLSLFVSSIDGTALTPGTSQTIDVENGTVSISAAGIITFTPELNYNGPVIFPYEISNGLGCTSTANENITVISVNDAPIAVADAYTTGEDTPVVLLPLTGDSDVDGGTLSVISINGTSLTGSAQTIPVTNGTVQISAGGVITFIPFANYYGPVSFPYQISDGQGGTATANENITVTSVNDAPVAVSDPYTTFEDNPLVLFPLTGDSDVDGGTLSVISINGTVLTGASQTIFVDNGIVSITTDGSIIFIPTPNYYGSISIPYQISDGQGGTATANENITVIPVNDPPSANADSNTTDEDVSVSFSVTDNDTDVDGTIDVSTVDLDPATPGIQKSFTIIGEGTYTVNNFGVVTFSPVSNYHGTATPLNYRVNDNNGAGSNISTISITVNSVDDFPVANDDTNTTFEDLPILGGITSGNDITSGDGGNVWSLDGLYGGALNGYVVMEDNGTYIYLPHADFFGTDSFTYTLCDSNGDCSTAKVNITVTSINDFPEANNDVFSIFEDEIIVSKSVANNDIPSGDGGNVWSLVGENGGALSGIVTMDPDGTFDYTPDSDFNGVDFFTYQICDVDGDCESTLVTININSVNDIPIANDDEDFSTTEDTPIIAGSVADNDIPSGDGGNTWTLFGTNGGAQHGKVTLKTDGTFDYIPASNYTGFDAFIYFVCDADNDCSAAIVSIKILPVNDYPIAENDINSSLINLPVTGNLLTNDSDPDGDVLTVNITPLIPPSFGTLTVNTDGTYTYIPNLGFSGNDSFVYEVCDNGLPSLCDQATAVIKVLEIIRDNNPPAALNDNYQGSENVAIVGNVLSNDFDPDDNLDVNSVTVLGLDPAHGSFTMLPNGKFTFVPEPNFTGVTSFEYRICDSGKPSLCDVAIVTIEILPNPLRNSTFATDDSFFGNEDASITGNVLTNDNDPQGDLQSVNTTLVVQPVHGTVIINSDGTFTYSPSLNYMGPDEFVYEVCDNGNPKACDQGTVILIVGSRNDPPVAKDDINSTIKDMPVAGNVLTNDTDPEGDLLTVKTIPVLNPANGSVELNSDGSYKYTPSDGFTGTDSFTYEVCDNGIPEMCTQATATFHVIDLMRTNNAPVANNDNYLGSMGIAVSGNVISNDFDPDGDLNLTGVTLQGNAPENGTLTLNPDGTFLFVPVSGFLGKLSFSYQVCDTGTPVLCDQANVNVEFLADQNVNSTDATDDSYFVQEDNPTTGNVLANDYDPQGDLQTVNTQPVVSPSNGKVVINSDGTFEYIPSPNYFGQDEFVYEICDNGSPVACARATVILIVGHENDAPFAKNDINNTLMNIPVIGNVLINDSDPEGNQLTIKTDPVVAPVNGSVVINTDGAYSYIPNSGYTGTDSFSYEICDNGSLVLCDQAIVTINIINPIDSNNAPVANNDAYQGSINTAVTGNVMSNDFDPDGNLDQNSIVLQGTLPSNGTLTLNSNGTFTFIPDPDSFGQVSFSYQVCDLGTPALCDVAVVTIEIIADHGKNSTVATDDSFFGLEENSVSGNVLNNDYDPQNDLQTVNALPFVLPLHGTVIINTDGTFVYTPESEYVGSDEFVYEVCDNGNPAACDQATVHLIVAPVNHIPVALDDTNITSEDSAVNGNVSTNDTPSRDGGNVWSLVEVAENGIVILNTDGSYTYTPDPDFNGTDSFDYQLCDVDGDCDIATVTISVNSVNDVPIANDDEFTLNLDGVLNETVAENDVASGDGGNIWTVVNQPANGSVLLNQDGSYTYTPKLNFNGSDSFTYELCDADGDCDQASVSVKMVDVVLPNQIFTPNNDGQNDTFYIFGIGLYPNNRLTIFNRWGNLVYEKSGYLNEWDGYANVKKVGNSPLPVGTYFYVLNYGNNKHKTGYIYLDR